MADGLPNFVGYCNRRLLVLCMPVLSLIILCLCVISLLCVSVSVCVFCMSVSMWVVLR